MKRIAITGPESTGKSDLSRDLAQHFHTIYVPEYARLYMEQKGLTDDYTYQDVLTMAKGQIAEERRLKALARGVLFSDTEMINYQVWLSYRGWAIPDWIVSTIVHDPFDLYLLCDIDLPWAPDPLRQNPHDRDLLLTMFKNILHAYQLPYQIVSGVGEERQVMAVSFVDTLLAT